MHWEASCSKRPGVLRKQFKSWTIPIHIRNELGLQDGEQIRLTISHEGLVHENVYQITSGGEIFLSATLASKLQKQAIEQPETSVKFTLMLLDGLSVQEDDFDELVRKAKTIPRQVRLARLAVAAPKPQRTQILVSVFIRNPYVVAEVLERANGKCERCNNPAPFLKKSDGSPYLEVHHRTRLADKGKDTVDNAIALCPNCHRELHYGDACA